MSNVTESEGKVWVPTRGERLRRAREDAGYRQSEFAELIDVSTHTISRYENNLGKPKRRVLEDWAAHTGYSKTFLDTGIIPAAPPETPTPIGRKKERTQRIVDSVWRPQLAAAA